MTDKPLDTPIDIRRSGRVLVITFNDPATRNAFSPELVEGSATAIVDAGADEEVGAIVLRGNGGTFCAGGNLNALNENRTAPRSRGFLGLERLHAWIRAMRTSQLPIIAAVEGAAAGAGFSIALACDLIVAAKDARFLMAYIKVGLNVDGGGSALLTRGLPTQLTSEILFEGGVIGAERLHQLGLVNRVVEPGAADAAALEWAERLAHGPRQALARTKRLIEAARTNALSAQLDLEGALIVEATHGAEAAEGITAFLEKRPPDFVAARKGK
jgi:enoyl-CoA hydratase/carnithine racemase